MVNFRSLAVGILAVASCSALPTSDAIDSSAQLAERQTTQARVVYCKHAWWAGACRTHVGNFGDCHNLGGDWNDKISSIKNDLGWGVACTWYEHHGCGASGGGQYRNQNDANLADGNGFWNDRVSSWKCGAFL